MLKELDSKTRLTGNQRRLVSVATFAVCLEFLDYFLIAFILAFVSVDWELTFGMSAAILLSSGVGAIAGGFLWGYLADRIGRRKVFLMTVGTFTLGTGALIFTPESAAIGVPFLVICRFIIGFGAGGLYSVDLPLVQEYMPASKRGQITGLVTAAVPLGFLAGSLLVWLVAPITGWRGLMVLCFLLAAGVYIVRLWIPESPRWLLLQGDREAARRSVAWALEVAPESLPLGGEVERAPRAKLSELLRYPRSLWLSWLTELGTQTGYYGLTLWTPTLLVIVMGIEPSKAGLYMVVVTFAAFVGRIVLSWLSERIGRRIGGAIAGGAAAAFLIIAGLSGDLLLGGISAFFLAIIVTYFFGEGGFAIVGPYSAEVWPSRLRTTGMGSAYGFGGIGKVIGPLGLAIVLGSSNLVKPEASAEGLLPAFIYFAAWYLLSAATFLFLGIETRGKSLEELDAHLETQSGGTKPLARSRQAAGLR
ncbi:MAG: sugar transporter [Homoserinimonas sp.]|nr:sugar transporter [Homoserinimonas sp.]